MPTAEDLQAELGRVTRERDYIEAALNARLADLYPDLRAEIERLRVALADLDARIFNDPQVIERAGEWRDLIASVLETTGREQPSSASALRE